MRNIYGFILQLSDKKRGTALATIISSSGSAPRKEGVSAVFSSAGLEAGTVGGGVLEETVKSAAIKSITEKKPLIVSINLENNIEDYESGICGGMVRVLIDPSVVEKRDFISCLRDVFNRNVPFAVITVIYPEKGDRVGTEKYVLPEGSPGDNLPKKYRETLVAEAEKMFKRKYSGIFSLLEMEIFPGGEKLLAAVEPVFPQPKLIIAGAGHIGKALSHLGRFLGFEVTVIDDRPEFANPVNLPDADKIIVGDIGTEMGKIKKDCNTYIVIVTRGHAKDAESLRECIGSNAAYIGMIGSKTKVEKMRRDFISKGWATEQQWTKIHSPVGMKINSKSVEEIAVSIAAEIILVKNSDDRFVSV